MTCQPPLPARDVDPRKRENSVIGALLTAYGKKLARALEERSTRTWRLRD
jgi:hypothetical protein